MKTLDELKQERDNLNKALINGSISVNEYQSFYYNLSQQIKKLEK